MKRNDTNRSDRALERYLARPGRRRLGEVIRVYQDFVYATALRVTGNAQDASDITQDVFLKLLLDPPAVKKVRSPSGYLAWCVVGRATNLRRAAERRKAREALGRELARTDALPAGDLEALHEAIRGLPGDLRAVIQLRYLAGLQNVDIAAALGVSERTVEERLRRARETLRQKLGPGLLRAFPFLVRPARHALSVPRDVSDALAQIARGGSALSVLLMKNAGPAVWGSTAALKIVTAAVAAALVLVTFSGSLLLWRRGHPPLRERTPTPTGIPPGAPVEVSREDSDHSGGGTSTRARASAATVGPERGSLFGTVSDDAGNRLPRIPIAFRQRIDEEAVRAMGRAGYGVLTPGELESRGRTDEEGRYILTKLLPVRGEFDLGNERFVQCYPYQARPEPGQEVRKDFTICRRFRLTGEVRSESGEALPGAEVLVDFDAARNPLQIGDYPGWRVFPTDKFGRYDTAPVLTLHKGNTPFAICALAEGHAILLRSMTLHEFTNFEAMIDFVLPTSMDLTLRVLDPRGRALLARQDPRVEYGMIISGRTRMRGTFGGLARRIAADRFETRNLLPGPYRVLLRRGHSGPILADAEIAVARGVASAVDLIPPGCTLIVPIQCALGTIDPEKVELRSVERRLESRPREPPDRWGGYRTAAESSGLRVSGLPCGQVRLLLVAEGFRETWTQPAALEEGLATTARVVTLVRGGAIVVRVESTAGRPVPREVTFRANRSHTNERVEFHCRRLETDPVWVLSAFAPGDYQLGLDAGSGYRYAQAEAAVPAVGNTELTVLLESS